MTMFWRGIVHLWGFSPHLIQILWSRVRCAIECLLKSRVTFARRSVFEEQQQKVHCLSKAYLIDRSITFTLYGDVHVLPVHRLIVAILSMSFGKPSSLVYRICPREHGCAFPKRIGRFRWLYWRISPGQGVPICSSLLSASHLLFTKCPSTRFEPWT